MHYEGRRLGYEKTDPVSFCLFAWLGCSGDTPTNGGEAGQPLRVEWQEGDVIVAMGTSLTFGYGSGCRVLPPRNPCSGDSSYPTLLSNELRLPVINLAQLRSTTADGLGQMSSALLLNPVLAVFQNTVQTILYRACRWKIHALI